MTDGTGDPYQEGVIKGALDAANAVGVNVLCFAGGVIRPPEDASPRNRVFDLISKKNVDGVVIVTSPLMHHVGRTGVESFLKQRLTGIPHSSIGVRLEGVPSVVTNNSSGIEHIMTHLVTQHQLKRFAFIRGPLHNDEAETRYQTYVQMLKKFELTLEPRLVFVGDFTQVSGRAAVRALGQIPGLRFEDLDAIVASNDNMAIGASLALEEQGILVPSVVAVTGFDDIDEARLASSPLTTVRQPLEKLGRQAARDMLHWMQIGTVPQTIDVEAELVVRHSCGCVATTGSSPPSAIQAAALEPRHSFEAALILNRQRVLDTLTRTARGELGVLGADWQIKLLNALVADIKGTEPEAFRNLLEEFGRRRIARGLDTAICHDVVVALRKQLIATLHAEPERHDRAEQIFYSAHLALSEVTQRGMIRDKLHLERWVRDIAYVSNTLSGTFDLKQLVQRIRDLLPRLGLSTYFVVTYSEQEGPNRASLLTGFDAGREIAAAEDYDFEAASLLPSHLMESISTGRAFVVLPLHCRNQSLGHALIDFDIEKSFCYWAISTAIGTALYGARLAAKCS
ncbi:MAG TPA: substrate-binding domain-containing protein [Polyangiaceae bacterium]|nr:substrate-binding domain-containing protein [Polyangiaceae bacterium]